MTDRTGSVQVHSVGPSAVTNSPDSASPTPVTFEAVFQFYSPYVWHTLRRLGVAPADLEDQTHEVFLQVYHQLPAYDPARPMRPWLFAFAFRKASEYRRSGQHRFELKSEHQDTSDPRPTALEILLQEEALSLGRAALSELELGQCAVFVLHELDGCPMPEVAQALEIPLNTAYSRLRLGRAAFERAVRRLRAKRGEP